jgi:hypothetical protein
MQSKENFIKAITDVQNAIAFTERLKTLTGDEKHIASLNKSILDGHKYLRELEEQYARVFGENAESPPLGLPAGREFVNCLRSALKVL